MCTENQNRISDAYVYNPRKMLVGTQTTEKMFELNDYIENGMQISV